MEQCLAGPGPDPFGEVECGRQGSRVAGDGGRAPRPSLAPPAQLGRFWAPRPSLDAGPAHSDSPCAYIDVNYGDPTADKPATPPPPPSTAFRPG